MFLICKPHSQSCNKIYPSCERVRPQWDTKVGSKFKLKGLQRVRQRQFQKKAGKAAITIQKIFRGYRQRKICPICLSQLHREKNIITICNHRFHARCIQNWCNSCKKTPATCPICREDLYREKEVIFVSTFLTYEIVVSPPWWYGRHH